MKNSSCDSVTTFGESVDVEMKVAHHMDKLNEVVKMLE